MCSLLRNPKVDSRSRGSANDPEWGGLSNRRVYVLASLL